MGDEVDREKANQSTSPRPSTAKEEREGEEMELAHQNEEWR